MALLRSFQDKRSVAELKSDTRYPEAEDYYFKMTSTERVRLLEDFDQEKNLAVPYLAYREAEIAFKEKVSMTSKGILLPETNSFPKSLGLLQLKRAIRSSAANKVYTFTNFL